MNVALILGRRLIEDSGCDRFFDLTYPVAPASTNRAAVEPTLKRQCSTLRLDPDVFSASSSRIA